MSADILNVYSNNPLFQKALEHIQSGEWQAGLAELDRLAESFPLEPEIRRLRSEMQLRSKIDEDERQDHIQARRRRLTTWSIRLLGAAALIAVIFWGIRTYSEKINQQWTMARQKIDSQVLGVERAVQFRDAQNLMQAGRTDEALALFTQLQEADPNYPGLEQALADAKAQADLDTRYAEALRLANLNDVEGALNIFEAIADQDPFYKDVSLRITQIKSDYLMQDVLAEADQAYQSEEWATAASKYEKIRALNPQYQPDLVEDRLFKSYMNAAVAALSADTQSLEALDVAEGYFRNALALRPQDPVIRSERDQARQSFKDRLAASYVQAAQSALVQQADSLQGLQVAEEYFRRALELRPDDKDIQKQRSMAQSYLKAQDEFSKGKWNDVITDLEFVYGEDQNYAGGTARQTLYEAYAARGNAENVAGVFEAALADFQRAAVLAEQKPDAVMQLFDIQVKVANVQNILGNYEGAIQMYQAAVAESGLRDFLPQDRPDLATKLEQADHYVDIGYQKSACRLYQEVMSSALARYTSVTHEVESGEYLTQLANKYGTTVSAILEANKATSIKSISPGEKLVIPVWCTTKDCR